MAERYVEAARSVRTILGNGSGILNGDELSSCFASILVEMWTAAERELDEDHADRLMRLIHRATKERLYQEIERRREALLV